MKNKLVKQTFAVALATQMLLTGVPVEAANVKEDAVSQTTSVEEEVAEENTDVSENTEESKEERKEDSEELLEEVIEKESKGDKAAEDEKSDDEDSDEEDVEDEDEEEKDKKEKKLKKEEEEEEKEIPTPVYSYDFEDEDSVKDLLRDNAKVKKDSLKGNKVLNLPGNGSMDLPEDLFEKIGEADNKAFTISMWVNPSQDAQNYSKFFDASNGPIGASERGASWWTDPDFAFAAGGGAYDMTLYVGDANKSTNVRTKLTFNKPLQRDKWQHLTVTFKEDEYKVYINGEDAGYTDQCDGTQKVTEVLPELVKKDYLKSLKYASLGKSYYTSDNDFKGSLDDVAFYDDALTADQVKELYDSFPEIQKPDYSGILNVDMGNKTGAVKHGATGYLYGVGEDNVPSAILQTAIKPYMCEQKPAEGLQHPNGDINVMAKTFLEAGGDSIQIACPDIYANWPYEYEGMDEYCEKLKTMVRQTKEAGLTDAAVYVLFNEPEGNWFNEIWSNDMSKFNAAWKQAYDSVKSVDPDAKTAGPNFCCYQARQLEQFMIFCAENDCIPTQISWHVLNNDLYNNFPNNVADYRRLEEKYWLEPGLITEKREIVINEYADFTHLGVPGSLSRWIGLFEDEKVTACLAYWHISNNLADLAASNNEPNGAWWLYKWYAEMSGETVSIDVDGLPKTQFYGVASVDDTKKSSNIIFGGSEKAVINLSNIDKNVFGDKIEVKFERTDWTGINGAAEAPSFMKKEVFDVDEDGNCTIKMSDLVAAAAYNLTITPADSSAEVGVVEVGPWKKTFEGEEAQLSGGARQAGKNPNFACSGSGQAQGLDSEDARATFKVDAPEDGFYRFDMVYGAGTGNNTQRPELNDPKNAVQKLYVDDALSAEMYLENTLTFYMSGLHTEYVYLTKGSHTLSVTGTDSEGKASIDCVYLTFVGDESAVDSDKTTKTYEAELSDYNILGSQTSTSVYTASNVAGFSGAGYAVGLDKSVKDGGGIRFVVFAKKNGTHQLSIRYNSASDEKINVFVNNTNKTLTNHVRTVKAAATADAWSDAVAEVFLEKGINIIDLDASSAALAVDKLTVAKVDDKNIDTVEAEDGKLIGNVEIGTNDVASNGKYVQEILASEDAENALEITYDAPVTGVYEMVVYQSNKELFGSHSYNAQMVDRFVTLNVNGGKDQTVYFRNTYSVDSFRTQCVKVVLKKGKNTLRFYNNDYRAHKNGVGGVNTCVNYTPNLDRFDFALVVADESAAEPTPAPTPVPTPAPTAAPANPSAGTSSGSTGSASSSGSSSSSRSSSSASSSRTTAPAQTQTIADAGVPAAGPATTQTAAAANTTKTTKKNTNNTVATENKTEEAEEEAEEIIEEEQVPLEGDTAEAAETETETATEDTTSDENLSDLEASAAVESSNMGGIIAIIVALGAVLIGAVAIFLKKGKKPF
ncbi:Concanavalin A-like lectin/glucanases superfamily protein [Pseudobutyrivibrio sp. UC1225]|uniref:LamG-like jellyroll fold domain-containing protein n=1 Tax=Pseudobutyrivibrio sp. UC1225 TaxID=1798185 RepID=UPI0008F137F7|nr:LamG-like jellyroll fold domain-containing protein [Pseudobutyrivibrio sp. UC1225]SFO28468.1 Concanavalin A-like lectin/glucanases superfamily protein [Pseudobutyrivibrio sp. UC1225]